MIFNIPYKRNHSMIYSKSQYTPEICILLLSKMDYLYKLNFNTRSHFSNTKEKPFKGAEHF